MDADRGPIHLSGELIPAKGVHGPHAGTICVTA